MTVSTTDISVLHSAEDQNEVEERLGRARDGGKADGELGAKTQRSGESSSAWISAELFRRELSDGRLWDLVGSLARIGASI